MPTHVAQSKHEKHITYFGNANPPRVHAEGDRPTGASAKRVGKPVKRFGVPEPGKVKSGGMTFNAPGGQKPMGSISLKRRPDTGSMHQSSAGGHRRP